MSLSVVGKIKTYSGLWFDFADPQEDQIEIEDIARSLSKICRYNGHVPGFYSVAEHSCYVASWLATHGYRHLAFAGLMHDAAEAYLGDIVNPMKKIPEFDRVYAPMEELVETVIGNKFNVDLYPINKIVKQADQEIYQWEVENIRTGEIEGYDPDKAYDAFMAFFRHYQPGKYYTRESQMENNVNVPNMTDAEMDEAELQAKRRTDALVKAINDMTDAEIAEFSAIDWDMDLTPEGEQELMKEIADLDASYAPTPRRALLMGAADLVDGDRNAQYGDPRQDFKRTAAYWNIHINAIIERKAAANGGFFDDNILEPHDVAIMMDLLKTSRLAWSPDKEDTWMDKAGYTACGWHCVMPEEDF